MVIFYKVIWALKFLSFERAHVVCLGMSQEVTS